MSEPIKDAAGACGHDKPHGAAPIDERNQWYGPDFCPHRGEPCIDGCSFCGARLAVDDHNHTKRSRRDEPERYDCVCFNC